MPWFFKDSFIAEQRVPRDYKGSRRMEIQANSPFEMHTYLNITMNLMYFQAVLPKVSAFSILKN